MGLVIIGINLLCLAEKCRAIPLRTEEWMGVGKGIHSFAARN